MSNGMLALAPMVFGKVNGAAPRANHLAFALLRCGLVFAALAVILSYVLLAATHIADRYQLNFCSSVYASLAAYLNEGILYPPLYDGSRYGGTRYMPLEFMLHAGLARLTGEYLVSGKVLTYTLTLALCLQLWVILRAVGCPRSPALALVSFLFLTDCSYLACTTIRGDLLPVVCQLGALLLIHGRLTRNRVAAAGLCCTLGILAKFSALWAPLAITAYLLFHHRRLLPLFLGACLLSLALVLAALYGLAEGRLVASFGALSAAGISVKDALLAPLIFAWKLGRGGSAVAFLVPALVVEAVAATTQRRLTIYHYSLFTCLLLLCGIFTDRGADYNHLVDLVVLAIVMGGCLWGILPPLIQSGGSLRLVLALTMLWVLFTGLVNTLVFPVVAACRSVQAHQVDPRLASPPLAQLIGREEPILAEDAWVELSRGRLPTIMDPYSVARLSASRPNFTDPLIRRIEAGEFSYLVLLQRLDADNPTDRYRWQDRAFGPPVVEAMRRHYRYHATREGYVLYVPNGALRDSEPSTNGGQPPGP